MLFSLQTGKSLCYSHQLNKTNSTKIQAVTSPTPQPLVHTPMVLISKSYVTLFSSYQIHKIFDVEVKIQTRPRFLVDVPIVFI